MKLSKTINKIQKTLLNSGQNVILDQAESSRNFKYFQTGIRDSIRKQVNDIASDDDLMVQLSTTTKADVNRRIIDILNKVWIPLNVVYNRIKGKDDQFFNFFLWAGATGGKAGLMKMGYDEDFNLSSDELINYLSNRSNLLIQSVDNTTKETISKLITMGQKELLTSYELSELLVDRFRDISKHRAESIARTELANAVNAVELETYSRNGVTKVRWVTSLDERVCPICGPLHNETVSIKQAFNSEGFSGNRPPAHVNCRCFLEEVIQGFEPDKENRIVWTGN